MPIRRMVRQIEGESSNLDGAMSAGLVRETILRVGTAMAAHIGLH
jgi:hypothetical protein